MKKLFLSVICASVLSACSDNVFLKDASGVTVRVGQKMSDGPALVRLEVMGDRLIHVSSTPERKFADPESLIIIEPEERTHFDVEHSDDTVAVVTASLRANVIMSTGEVWFTDPDGDTILREKIGGGKTFTPVEADGVSGYSFRLVFESPDDEAFYGLGQHQSDEFNYKGRNEELFQLIVCQNDVEKEEQVRAAYPQLIERIRKYGVNYQIAMMNYAEYLFGIRDYRLAEKQYTQLVENATEEDPCAQRANFLLRLAYIRELMNKDSRDCDRLFEEGKKLLARGKEEPDVWIENYQTAAQDLIERGRYQEAVTILDEGIGLCLERNGDNIYDTRYLEMISLKTHVMYNGLNQMVEAKQLMVEQMEKMFRNKETVGSLTLLNYLWECYYLVKGENAYDMVQRNEFLMPLLQVSQMLYAQNGQDPLFMMNYVTPLLIEFLDIATHSMVWTKNMRARWKSGML